MDQVELSNGGLEWNLHGGPILDEGHMGDVALITNFPFHRETRRILSELGRHREIGHSLKCLGGHKHTSRCREIIGNNTDGMTGTF